MDLFGDYAPSKPLEKGLVDSLLSTWAAHDVFPPGFVLECPTCRAAIAPASLKGACQLLRCPHAASGEGGEPFSVNTRGVARGGPHLSDVQSRIRAWARTEEGWKRLREWKDSMTEEDEKAYWSSLGDQKRRTEAQQAELAAKQQREEAQRQAAAAAAAAAATAEPAEPTTVRHRAISLSTGKRKASRVGAEFQASWLPPLASATQPNQKDDDARSGAALPVGDQERLGLVFEKDAYAECPICKQHLQAPQRANALVCPTCRHQLTAAAWKEQCAVWSEEEVAAFDRGMFAIGKALLTSPPRYSGRPPELAWKATAEMVEYYYSVWKCSTACRSWRASEAKHNALVCPLCSDGGSLPTAHTAGLLCCDGCPSAYHIKCLAHFDAGHDGPAPPGYVPIALVGGALSLGALPRDSGWYCRRCVEAKLHVQAKKEGGAAKDPSATRKRTRIAALHTAQQERRAGWQDAGKPALLLCSPDCSHCTTPPKSAPASSPKKLPAGSRQPSGRRHAIAANKVIAGHIHHLGQEDAMSDHELARMLKHQQTSAAKERVPLGRCVRRRYAEDLFGGGD